MKKSLIAIISVVLVAAIAVGSYFIFFNKEEDTNFITATREDFFDVPELLEALAVRPETYKKILAEEYELGEKKADEFYECPEEWLTYEQLLTIYNNSGDNVTVYGFEVPDNGKNGVYIYTSLGGELEIAAGGNGPTSFSILCDNGDLSTDEAKALVDNMLIKVIYSKTPVENADGTVSEEEMKTAVIEIPAA